MYIKEGIFTVKKVVLSVLCCLFFVNYLHAQIYIAPNGDDDYPGTKEQPFETFPKAILEATPGDTIYVRGGVYDLTSTIRITAVKNGSENQLYTLTAYNDEVPILDFSAQSFGSKGISLQANYWHIKGLQVKGAGDNGMDINLWSIFTVDDKIPQNDSHRICTIYFDDQTQCTTSTFNFERLAFWEYS